MKSIVKVMITCMAIIGLTASVVAANNNGDGAGGQQGNGQGARPGGAKLKVCRADIKKFCKGVKPGEGRIIACLKTNLSSLSSDCAALVSKAPDRQAQEPGQGRDGDDSEK
ncbi:MAG: cysteine rich repeat-containing protein [Betaproteobacteria bacterium]|nr:cysteine rich repeat-containing protein [Betaproteobacteria bacterium]